MRLTTLLFTMVILLCFGPEAGGETKIEISGQVRVRNGLEQPYLRFGTDIFFDNLLRARVGLKATVDSNTTAFICLQDSRNFPETRGTSYSGDEYNSKNVDAHEAYIEVHRWLPGLSAKAGRFEFVTGNGRLFGADDWDNVGRAWNGAQVSLNTKHFDVAGFGLVGPGISGSIDIDELVWGVWSRIRPLNLEPLFYYQNSDSVITYTKISTNRFTAAFCGRHRLAVTGISWNLAYQFGNVSRDYFGTWYGHSRYDISAWMLNAEFSGTAHLFDSMGWSLGLDIESGDTPYMGETDNRFSSPYSSKGDLHGRELWVGQSTYVNLWAKRAGLVDAYAGITLYPVASTSVGLRVHHFSTNRPFSVGLYYTEFVEDMHDLGWQPELTIVTHAVKGLRWELGATAFEPTTAYARSVSHNVGYFAYSQMTVDF